jgi:hypothetical protein
MNPAAMEKAAAEERPVKLCIGSLAAGTLGAGLALWAIKVDAVNNYHFGVRYAGEEATSTPTVSMMPSCRQSISVCRAVCRGTSLRLLSALSWGAERRSASRSSSTIRALTRTAAPVAAWPMC